MLTGRFLPEQGSRQCILLASLECQRRVTIAEMLKSAGYTTDMLEMALGYSETMPMARALTPPTVIWVHR